MIDADLAEFVFNDGDALAVVLGQDAVKQGGLARAEKPVMTVTGVGWLMGLPPLARDGRLVEGGRKAGPNYGIIKLPN